MTHFGPMTSSQDGIDRLTVRVNFRVSRADIVSIVAHEFRPFSRLTKTQISEAVWSYLESHGTAGIKRLGYDFPEDWQQRYEWADAQISKLFRGWS